MRSHPRNSQVASTAARGLCPRRSFVNRSTSSSRFRYVAPYMLNGGVVVTIQKSLCPWISFSFDALQVLTMGDAFSLEQRLQLGEGAALQEKLEITLLNLVLPLLLLVGSGRKVTSLES